MKIPLPGPGQPIDTVYLYKIVEAINDLSNVVTSATFNYTTVDTAEAGRQSIKTSQAKIFGGSVNLVSNESVIKDSAKTWYIDLPPGFKYAPNAVATVVNRGATVVGNSVLVTITNVTKSRIDGTAKFLSGGIASVQINVQAVGVPE